MDRDNNQNIKPFAMFVCSLLPGCAHMYMGLMKRGIQLMLIFLLGIGISAVLGGLAFVTVPLLVVLYVYSFFDGYSIYRNFKAGKVVEDESIIEGLDSVTKLLRSGYWIGVVLIVLGGIVLVRNTTHLPFIWDNYRHIMYRIDDYIPAVVLMALGVFLMIKGNKQRKRIKEEKQKQLSE